MPSGSLALNNCEAVRMPLGPVLIVPDAGVTVGNAAITVPVAVLASVVDPFGLLAVALTSMVRPSSVCLSWYVEPAPIGFVKLSAELYQLNESTSSLWPALDAA